MNYSAKQQEIIETTEPNVIVISAASSGKTTVVTARINFLLDAGIPPKDIVAITFTNLAAEELHNRLGAKGADCFIGTIHSYCNRLLKGIGIDTSKLIESEDFDGLFKLVQKYPECIKDVEYLFLDEAQDSNENQFKFLLDMVRADNIMLVGDPKQSIYQFNGARPDIFCSLAKSDLFTVYDLNENYRNGKTILHFAKDIIKQGGYNFIDTSKAMREENGEVLSVEYSSNGIARTLAKEDDLKNWFILCRSNNQVDTISNALNKYKVNNAVIRKKDFNTLEELRDKLNENSVKVMTVHAAKGLEADNVVVIGCDIGNAKRQSNEAICVNYVAATRARNKLIWTYMVRRGKSILNSWE